MQWKRAHKHIVDRHVHRPVLGHGIGRVAIGQVQWNALGIPGKQVGGQAGLQVHASIQHSAAHLQLGWVLHQFAQLHGPVRWQPTRGIVGFALRRVIQRGDLDGLAGQRCFAQCQRIGGHLNLGIVFAQNQQQLAPHRLRMGNHGKRGQLDSWQIFQKSRSVGIGGQHHTMPGRQPVVQHRKLVATVSSQHPHPPGYRASRLDQSQTGWRTKNHRQLDGAAILRIEKRQGQQSQVVAQGHFAQAQIQAAFVADAGPQAGVRGQLAFHCVVPDELETQTVVVGEIARIDVQLDCLCAAQFVFVEDQRLQQLFVEQHLQVRQGRQQGWRKGEHQPQAGRLHHLVTAHAHAHTAFAFNPTQRHQASLAHVFE